MRTKIATAVALLLLVAVSLVGTHDAHATTAHTSHAAYPASCTTSQNWTQEGSNSKTYNLNFPANGYVEMNLNFYALYNDVSPYGTCHGLYAVSSIRWWDLDLSGESDGDSEDEGACTQPSISDTVHAGIWDYTAGVSVWSDSDQSGSITSCGTVGESSGNGNPNGSVRVFNCTVGHQYYGYLEESYEGYSINTSSTLYTC